MIDHRNSWSDLLFSFIFLSQTPYFWSLSLSVLFLFNNLWSIINYWSLLIDTLNFLSVLGKATATLYIPLQLATLAGRGRAAPKNRIARCARRSDQFMIFYLFLIPKPSPRYRSDFTILLLYWSQFISIHWSLITRNKIEIYTTQHNRHIIYLQDSMPLSFEITPQQLQEQHALIQQKTPKLYNTLLHFNDEALHIYTTLHHAYHNLSQHTLRVTYESARILAALQWIEYSFYDNHELSYALRSAKKIL